MWEHFHHQADIGIRGTGKNFEEAFEQAALALTAVICSHKRIDATQQIDITCHENDIEMLFIDWINAIIYEMATRGMLFSKYKVRIDGGSLKGKAWGEEIDNEKHETIVEVKAATYSLLKVEKRQDGQYIAQCVVDV